MTEKVTAFKTETSLFLDHFWILAIKASQAIGGTMLFDNQPINTAVGMLPLAQILGAVLITDAVLFVWRLVRQSNTAPKKK